MYNPDYVTPPGTTLQETLEVRGIYINKFADQLGISIEQLDKLFKGDMIITDKMAQQLEDLLNIPARFWIRRERYYRNSL